jgi:integrase
MTQNWTALSHPDQLGLTKREQTKSLPRLLQFLQENPNPLGQVLLGIEEGPWTKRDVALFESLALGCDEKEMADFLSITRSAAHFWSVRAQKTVPLPRYYFDPGRGDDSPLGPDYAAVVAKYRSWCGRMSSWVHALFSPGSPVCNDRSLLLAALISSAMLHGGAIGVRFLGAIVRAIAQKRERTFVIGGRIHIELSLSWYAVADAESRIWLPDPLTATLWHWVETTDVTFLLEPVLKPNGARPPNDVEIFKRLGHLIRTSGGVKYDQELGGLAALRHCCWVVAHTSLRPVLARYCDCEISSNSLERQHLRRLFPKGELVQFSLPAITANPQPLCTMTATSGTESPPPEWMGDLLSAAKSKSTRPTLEAFANAENTAVLARRLAGFGVSLLSTSLYSGKHLKRRDLPKVLGLLATCLGQSLADQDIAEIDMPGVLEIYVRVINEQPMQKRRSLISWLLEFDLYLRACVKEREPIPKAKLPWPPDAPSEVDIGLATHEEYSELLRRIDRLWDVRDSERRRKMVRLIVILSFRCGLRRNEIRSLRVGGVLIRGIPELLIWPRKGEPRKSRNARRRVPIGALLSEGELGELRTLYEDRVQDDKAAADDRLFALPKENLKWIPNSLFDKLNCFLRDQSRWDNDNEDDGIHGHTLRHAFGGWLFISLMLSDMEQHPILFPDLDETNAWLKRGPQIYLALFEHFRPTGKHPSLVASLSAHAGFDTTAHSYIHLFPWLTAAALDGAEEMAPAESLVKLACHANDSTYRAWMNKHGIHGVAVQLMKSNGADIRVESGSKTNREVLPAPMSSRASWAEQTWGDLHRLCTNDLNVQSDATIAPMARRAEHICNLTTSRGKYRHMMETWPPGKHNLDRRFRIACPANPIHKRNDIPAGLCSRIAQMHNGDAELVRDAVGIYVHHLAEKDWVRFDTTAESAKANRYIAFLFALGLGPRQIQFACGATTKDLHLRDKWRSKLAQPNLVIMLADNSRNSGPKTSLSIRPLAGSTGGTETGYAGFRFIMVMTYIAFGADPITRTG